MNRPELWKELRENSLDSYGNPHPFTTENALTCKAALHHYIFYISPMMYTSFFQLETFDENQSQSKNL